MMAGFFTDYLNNKVLDQIFGASVFASYSTLYIGLSQGSANKNGTTNEPSSGGYTRVSVANNLTNFPAAFGGTKSNAATIVFPVPTADWGTIQSLFVADAASGGNVLSMADLTAPKPLPSGSSAPKVAMGALFLSHT
ncbi:MAG: hypothetical protein NVSMB9_01320 [Isosphaeraceae bacterium]